MVYEITSIPGIFVALDVRTFTLHGERWVSFWDTSHSRMFREREVDMRPMTVDVWNRDARTRFNSQAPRFATIDDLETALRGARYD